MRALVPTLLLALLPGCSLLFVEGPPPGHQRLRYFDCTSSRLAPIVDTVFSAVYGLGGVVQAADMADADVGGDVVPAVLVPLGLAALFGVSAAHGYATTSECEDAKARWAHELLSAPARAAPSARCGRDTDCPGAQICDQGTCVIVEVPPAPPAALAPIETVPPAAAPAEAAPVSPTPPATVPAAPAPVAPAAPPVTPP
jgi:hypothetical protein